MPIGLLPGVDTELDLTDPSPIIDSLCDVMPSNDTQRAEISLSSGQFENAKRFLEEALRQEPKPDPKDAYARAVMGRILKQQGHHERNERMLRESVEYFDTAIKFEPKLDWALTELVYVLIALKRKDEALGRVQSLIDRESFPAGDKEAAPALGLKGRLQRMNRQLKEASETIRHALELAPDLAWIHAEAGEIYRNQRRYADAIKAFNEAGKLAKQNKLPVDVRAWIDCRKGMAFKGMRNNHAALQALSDALRISPQNTQALEMKVRLLWNLEQQDLALETLRGALASSPGSSALYMLLVYFGQLEEALASLNKYLGKEPSDIAALINKGELLHRAGEYEATVKLLEEEVGVQVEDLKGDGSEMGLGALEQAPEPWRAFGLLGSALKYLGPDRSDKALAAFDEALRILVKTLPDVPARRISEASLLVGQADVMRFAGQQKNAREKYGQAAEILQRVFEDDPASVDATNMWLLGASLMWLGECEEAGRLLQRAKWEDRSIHILNFVLGLAFILDGQLHRAERTYEGAIRAIKEEWPIDALLRHGILKAAVHSLDVAASDASLDEDQSAKSEVKRILKQLEEALGEAIQETTEIRQKIWDTESHPETEPPAAPARSTFARLTNLSMLPTAEPTTPMIRLDNNFCVVDWNVAASLAFDHTLGGQTGQWVGEWLTLYLDNPLAAAEHGQKAFGDPDHVPMIDVEEQHFTSKTYGPFDMTKRAYNIPHDDGTQLGWLMTFELKFNDEAKNLRFQKDLIREVTEENRWSEHALSYDQLLSNLKLYDELIGTMIGEIGPLEEVAQDARVLDLGAGAGNLTYRLASTSDRRFIYAVDKSAAMLNMLRKKCADYLRDDAGDCGVVSTRHDIAQISQILGDLSERFDIAFLVNVLNTVKAPKQTLEGVHKLLKPGGEVRITGPRKDSDVDVLFDAFRKDLEERGLYEKLQPFHEHLYELNKSQLAPGFAWSVDDVADMLRDVGFSEITHSGEGLSLYAGESMVVCARK